VNSAGCAYPQLQASSANKHHRVRHIALLEQHLQRTRDGISLMHRLPRTQRGNKAARTWPAEHVIGVRMFARRAMRVFVHDANIGMLCRNWI
jgi:hypothetical protein